MNREQSDPRTYLRLFWRWKLVFLVCLVAVPAIAYAIVSREHKTYQSSLLLEENANTVDTSITGGSTVAPTTQANQTVVAGQARVIETPRVAKIAAGFLHPSPANPSSLLSHISASGDSQTGFITVKATAANPHRAADIANAFGAATVKLRNAQAVAELTAAINRLQVQIARAGSGGKAASATSADLTLELAGLRAERSSQTNVAQVLQAAVPNASPISPRTSRAVLLALIGGLLLGIGAVFVAESADRRLRHPEDLEEITGLPLLATVARSAFSGDALVNSQDSSSFEMLRSALTFFNVDQPLTSVLIASPLQGDGKTTVATRLAVAAARGGRDVILVDADLRRPQAASRLHVGGEPVAPGHGLSGVLTGQVSLGDALVRVSTAAHAPEGESAASLHGELHLLPAGGNPPNPSELLAAGRMRELLEELEGMADLVVIDTSPLLAVSDALPLLDAAAGVVLIARLNSTRKDALKRVIKLITNTNATVLGVVATGAVRRRLAASDGYYGYGYGYYANGSSNGKRSLRRRATRKAQQST